VLHYVARPCLEPENAGGQDVGHGGATLVGCRRRVVVEWSPGAPPGGVAHNDLRLATGALPGVNGCWRGERPRRLYLLTYPAQVRCDELGSERDRPVNFSGSVNQRVREFWAEILGGIELLTAELTVLRVR